MTILATAIPSVAQNAPVSASTATPLTCRALADALAAVDVPTVAIAADGLKEPAVSEWKYLQHRVATPQERDAMFLRQRFNQAGNLIASSPRHVGIAWIMRLDHEVLDIETPATVDALRGLIEDKCPGLLARLVAIQTPKGGMHFSYRHDAPPERSQKLAQEPWIDDAGKNGRRTLIETRALGGYALLPGSPLACHPLHKPYVLLQGRLTELPRISADERNLLLRCARTLDTWQASRVGQQRQQRQQRPRQDGPRPESPYWITRPGDEYNARATWDDILVPQGWHCVGQRDDTRLWCRPGKERGTSATTSNFGAHGILYVFSSNADPFEPDTSYSKFSAYAEIYHEGNLTAAAEHLHKAGYGERREQPEPDAPVAVKGTVEPRRPRGIRLPSPDRPSGVRLPMPERPVGIRLPAVHS